MARRFVHYSRRHFWFEVLLFFFFTGVGGNCFFFFLFFVFQFCIAVFNDKKRKENKKDENYTFDSTHLWPYITIFKRHKVSA